MPLIVQLINFAPFEWLQGLQKKHKTPCFWYICTKHHALNISVQRERKDHVGDATPIWLEIYTAVFATQEGKKGPWIEEGPQKGHKCWIRSCKESGSRKGPIYLRTVPALHHWELLPLDSFMISPLLSLRRYQCHWQWRKFKPAWNFLPKHLFSQFITVESS